MKIKLKPFLTQIFTAQEMKSDVEIIGAHHKDKKINQSYTSSPRKLKLKHKKTPCHCNKMQLRLLICVSIYHFVQNYPVTKNQDISLHKMRNQVSEPENLDKRENGETKTVIRE